MNATSQVPAWFDRQSARKVALLVAVAAALPRRGVVVLVPPRATISPAARARLPTRRPLIRCESRGEGSSMHGTMGLARRAVAALGLVGGGAVAARGGSGATTGSGGGRRMTIGG